MPAERRCAKCDAPLTVVGGADLCPGCLLEAGLGPAAPDRPLSAGTVFGETEPVPVAPGVGEARAFGDYELLEEIAHGGMGVVYRARQRSLDRLVAVKMLLFGPHASADLIRRFKTEAVAAGALHHPNIVAVHEVGLRDGRHYIVMDYVDGPNLAQLVKERPPPARQAAGYLKTIAEAVHHAHEHGVLHRDLKPSNVLLDARDQPQVTDFGLARRLDTDSSLTFSGQVLGSPNFMPPEQVTGAGAKVGRRSDVYGLGATLYHLLTGRPPFQGESLQATLHQVLTAEAVSPRLLNPVVPRDLEIICLKCLEKEPARRYATAQELADELGRFLRDEPIQARPVSRPERVWRWARRKPVLALLLLLVHLVGAAGLAGIVWQWLRAEQNAIEARTQRDTAEGRLYAAQLRLAHADYRAGRLGSARQRLEAWEPARRAPGRPDWRGFEWRWLQRLCAASPGEVIATNASGFTAVAASPDGTSLALGAHDGTIQLLDVSTSASGTSWRAHPGAIDSVEFIPGQTHWLVTVGGDEGLLKVWDIGPRPQELVRTNCSTGLLAFVAVSRTGRLIAAGAADHRSVNVWELTGGRNAGPPALRLHRNFEGPGPAAFSPDERTLAVANRDRFHLAVCDLSSGTVEILRPEHKNFIKAVAYAPDNRWIATGAADETVALWETVSRVRTHLLRDEDLANLSALRFSADGRMLFAAGSDQNVRGWSLAAPGRTLAFRGHQAGVTALAGGDATHALVSASRDGTVRRWRIDAAALSQAAEVPAESEEFKAAGGPDSGLSLAVSGDSRSLAVSFASEVWVFDLPTGQVRSRLASARAFGRPLEAHAVAFSPVASLLAAGGQEGWVTLLDGTTLQPVSEARQVHDQEVSHLSFALDGRVVVSAGRFGGGLAITEVEPWRVRRRRPAAGNLPLEPIAVSPNGRLLAAASPGHCLTVEEVGSGRLVAVCPHPVRFLHAVVFSPDGASVAFSDESGRILLWNWAGRSPLRQWSGHHAEVLCLAFSPDGRTLASGSMDHTIRLWHADLDQEVAILTGHNGWIFHLAFDAASEVLASVASDGAVRVWRALPAAGGREAGR
jgi:WD40 repeat protein/predicted Ser/Thr protein kinase